MQLYTSIITSYLLPLLDFTIIASARIFCTRLYKDNHRHMIAHYHYRYTCHMMAYHQWYPWILCYYFHTWKLIEMSYVVPGKRLEPETPMIAIM